MLLAVGGVAILHKLGAPLFGVALFLLMEGPGTAAAAAFNFSL
jgi:hypothetical protein